jgi:hypothetical protein
MVNQSDSCPRRQGWGALFSKVSVWSFFGLFLLAIHLSFCRLTPARQVGASNRVNNRRFTLPELASVERIRPVANAFICLFGDPVEGWFWQAQMRTVCFTVFWHAVVSLYVAVGAAQSMSLASCLC